MTNLKMKKEFKVIAELLPNNSKVLDVGCGDGSLMNFLEKEKNIIVRGLELNQDNVQQCIHKGLSVIQGNAETELNQFPNQSFDYVVLSQTLQAFYDPEKVLKDLLRIGKSVVIHLIWILESKNKSFIVWQMPLQRHCQTSGMILPFTYVYYKRFI